MPRVFPCHAASDRFRNWEFVETLAHDDALAIFATLTDRQGAPPFRRFLRKTVPEIVCCRTSALTDEHLLGDLKHEVHEACGHGEASESPPSRKQREKGRASGFERGESMGQPPSCLHLVPPQILYSVSPAYFWVTTTNWPGSRIMKSSNPSELKSAGAIPKSPSCGPPPICTSLLCWNVPSPFPRKRANSD